MPDIPKIDIRPDLWQIVHDILQKHVSEYEVWAFGSRAKWTAKEYSDLDLAIISEKPLSLDISASLSDDFSESDLPWRVDVVDWATTSESFRKIIERDKVIVQKAGVDKWIKHEVSKLISDGKLIIGDGYRAKNDELTKVGLPFARAGNINQGFSFKDADYFPKENLKRVVNKLSQPGDVVFTSKGTVGRFAFVLPSTPQFVYSPQLCFWRSLDNSYINSRFLYYWMHGQEFYSQFKGVSSKTDMAEYVSLTDQRSMKITLPSPEKQGEIADVLGALDDKIELNRSINQTLEQIAQAIFKSWFIDFDPVKAKIAAKKEGRDPLRAAMSIISGKTDDELDELPQEQYEQFAATAALFPDEMEESELKEIPKKWKLMPLSQMIELIGGGTPKRSEIRYWNGDIPWFSVKDSPGDGDVFVIDTEEHITDAGLKESSTKLLPEGVTIISARGTVGKLALVGQPMAMNQSCYGVRGSKGIGQYFNYFNLKYSVEKLRKNTHGAVFDTITQSTFDTVLSIKPEKCIADEFEQILIPVFLAIKNNLSEITTLSKTRDFLLPKLLSGDSMFTPNQDVLSNAES